MDTGDDSIDMGYLVTLGVTDNKHSTDVELTDRVRVYV